MISIDRISFEFAMNDELFAHSLYADWNGFCRTCFENIVEECLSAFDKDRVLHEIEKLDFDLGSIPQEDFYSEFPRRLRKRLLKALPSLQLGQSDMEEGKTAVSRFANLLYYLEHGALKTEWADAVFNLSEELTGLIEQDKRYMEKIAGLCMANEYILKRLLLQTDDDTPLVYLYSLAMDRIFSVKDRKRRFMKIFLEMRPDIPLRFVHRTEEDGRLHSMAELLDTHSVRKIMQKETEEHAEVDLPPYWHYLYEWLIKYYPYNGLAIFGGKNDFIAHLHYQLLTFIRKRNHTFYLSKTELTATFLLEVFGGAHYKEVLNAIYKMQPRNADGSPAYDGDYNRQLYCVFMQLSLLHLPMSTDDNADEVVSKKKEHSLLMDFRMENLSAILKDVGRSDADKRMIVTILIQQKPEELIVWLRNETIRDKALITVMAGLIDEKILIRLLTSVSLVAMETVYEVIRYLVDFVRKKRLTDSLSYESFTLAVRKAVLLWIKCNGYALSANESSKSLLQLINKEVTGEDNEKTVEEWTEELHLFENETKDFQLFVGQGDDEIKESIRRLRVLLTAENIVEVVKRRLVVSFLERHKDRYADTVWELHVQGLLEGVIKLASVSATESVIRQMIICNVGTGEADKLLALIDLLFVNENSVSDYLLEKSLTLRTQVLVLLAKEIKAQVGTVKASMEQFTLLLVSLFGNENISAVVGLVLYGMIGEVATDEMKKYDILKVIDLLPYTGSFRVHYGICVFEQWSQKAMVYSNTIQMLLQSRWNTSDSFVEWLKDTGVAIESKRELLQTLAREKLQELVGILRNLPRKEETVSLAATYIPMEVLLAVVEKANAKQGLLLSRTVNLLQRERTRFAFLSNITLPFATALSQALLLFIQDKDTLDGRNLTEQEVVAKFLSHLYYVYTRRTDYNDYVEWKKLQQEVVDGLGLNGMETAPETERDTFVRLWSEYSRLNDTELYNLMIAVLDKQPAVFVELSESKADTNFVKRISCMADIAMFRRIVKVLSSTSRFENYKTFIRLMEWISTLFVNCTSTSNIVSTLLSWMSTTDWKSQTVTQMTTFFISHLYESNDIIGFSLEILMDKNLPEEVRKQLFCDYMHSHPLELLRYIQQLAAQDKLPMDKFVEWTDFSDWLRLTACVSLSLEELLRQVVEYLLSKGELINEKNLKHGLLTFIAVNDVARFAYYIDKAEVVNSFLLSLSAIQVITIIKKEEIMDEMMNNLGLTPEEQRMLERSLGDNLEIASVGNAGLCLFSLWFPQLFKMLDYLNEERKDFKDIESRIRAVFLLQYLACAEEKKEYREQELVFNRLLVALPAHVSLPKQMELTDKEKQIVNDLIEGVKANWRKMDGTSVNGFRQSFILRNGQLEQQDERWLLTVENRAFDFLLDTIPWAFRQIRFPWLKKYVQISWHDKQEF